ncbi:MarR family winged helix-turn-helix transcriptional regulator [Agromyces rhizosphaerae]|uniref:MarR family winged helix-turn-helix transcriptional regulator n=1 Tax=Agromyces rhizosphaerae TaxID=88374 RepID=UPI00249283B1|nr:MarR family transcriptional regulator [Agromyces rhizosphaerae]
MTQGTPGADADSYWYEPADDGEAAGLEVLRALRRYRDAESGMQRRTRDDMDMNETDLRALRLVIRAEQEHRELSSAELARALDISTAATTKLVARLVRTGYLSRAPHPVDRRVQLIGTQPGAHTRIRETLGRMHREMLDVASDLGPGEQRAIVGFLDRMSDLYDAAQAAGAGGRTADATGTA